MKLVHLCFLILSAATLPGAEVTLRFLDDDKQPLPGVSASIIFTNRNSRGDVVREGLSDAAGLFSARSTAEGWISVRATMEGRYGTGFLRLDKSTDHDLTLIMRRIIRPIPLYADSCRLYVHHSRNPPPIPYVEGTYAYDLEVGELLPPHGNGRVADVQVHSRAWFQGWTLSEEKLREEEAWARGAGLPEGALRIQYGRWRSEQVITFPGKDAGFVQVGPEDFQPYCDLRHPHQAPLEGYQPEIRGTAATGVISDFSVDKPTVGYFLRLRVKHDAQGRIVSAHYAKAFGVIGFNAYGGAVFAYVFNPTPNDRNLEFDRGNNLFKGRKPLFFDPFR